MSQKRYTVHEYVSGKVSIKRVPEGKRVGLPFEQARLQAIAILTTNAMALLSHCIRLKSIKAGDITEESTNGN